MSERGVHPVIWLGLGAAGVWGASHYLGPMKARPRSKNDNPPAAVTSGTASGGASLPAAGSAAPSATWATATTTRPAAAHASTPTRAAPAAASASAAMSREFDPVFGAFSFGRGLPVAYLRALAWSESRLKPAIDGGLFQIVGDTRDDFARRHKLDASKLDLRNPMTSTAIAADVLAIIKTSLATKHPRQLNAIADWTNPRFVELLTHAYNAGWSESRGVGRVLAYLDERGQFNATIDDIAKHARAAGAVAWLYAYPERQRYARAVAERFASERERDARERVSAFYQGGTKPKAVA